jgi:hypothetical protein
LLALAFFPMAAASALKWARRNYLMLSSVALVLLLVLLIFISSSVEELKVQRAYLYIAPFVGIASAWGFVSFLRAGRRWRKGIAIIVVAGSIAMSFAAIPHVASDASNSDIAGMGWMASNGMDRMPIATEGYSSGIGRGLGVRGLTVYDYSFHNEPGVVVSMLTMDGVNATFVSSQLTMLHNRMQDQRVALVYLNGGTEVFVF